MTPQLCTWPHHNIELVRYILMQMPVTDDEASRRKVVFHYPHAVLAYALFAADRPICADAL